MKFIQLIDIKGNTRVINVMSIIEIVSAKDHKDRTVICLPENEFVNVNIPIENIIKRLMILRCDVIEIINN